MFNEELLYDIMLCLKDKSKKDKEEFFIQNKEVLDFLYKNQTIKEYLIEKNSDLKEIIQSLNSDKRFNNFDSSINSERSKNINKSYNQILNNNTDFINKKEQCINKLRESIRNYNKLLNNNNKTNLNIFKNEEDYVYDDDNFNLFDNDEKDDCYYKPLSNKYLDEFLTNNNKTVVELNNNKNLSIKKLKIVEDANCVNEEFNNNSNKGSIIIKNNNDNNDNNNNNTYSNRISRNINDIEKSNTTNKNSNSNIINESYTYKPRYAIASKLRRKNLDNSVDDYMCFEYVDQKGYEQFKDIAKSFIIKKLKNKTNEIVEWYKHEMIDCFEKAIIELESKEINEVYQYLEGRHNLKDSKEYKKSNTINKKDTKSIFNIFKCCSSNKENKIKIIKDYNMQENALILKNIIENIKSDLVNIIDSYKEDMSNNTTNTYLNKNNNKELNKNSKNNLNYKINKSIYTNSKKLNEFLDINYLVEYLNSNIEEKYNLLYNDQDMDNFLKEEVDKYSEFFNIDHIIEKQENRIKMQTAKLNQLEEFKVLNECIICMDNERNVAFLPCLHFICCETCAFSLIKTECPQCHGCIETKKIILN